MFLFFISFSFISLAPTGRSNCFIPGRLIEPLIEWPAKIREDDYFCSKISKMASGS